MFQQGYLSSIDLPHEKEIPLSFTDSCAVDFWFAQRKILPITGWSSWHHFHVAMDENTSRDRLVVLGLSNKPILYSTAQSISRFLPDKET